jgi:hypothetical protein
VTADRHRGPVPESAWAADADARRRGRVQMFNAARPGGLDGWTMDLEQYELVREHILGMLDDEGVLLADVVAAAQARFGRHPAFPGGRLRNYCTFTKVDLEARCLIERVPGSGPQRLRLRGDPPSVVTRSEQLDDVEEGVAGPSPS